MQKLSALVTTPSGLALIATFIIAGLQATQSHFTGNVSADIGTVVAILGLIFHPTTMIAGHSVKASNV